MSQVPDENTFTDPVRLLSVLNSIPTIPEKPVEIFDKITHSCHADSAGTLIVVKGTAKLKGGRVKPFAVTFWESQRSSVRWGPPDAEVDFEWLAWGVTERREILESPDELEQLRQRVKELEKERSTLIGLVAYWRDHHPAERERLLKLEDDWVAAWATRTHELKEARYWARALLARSKNLEWLVERLAAYWKEDVAGLAEQLKGLANGNQD